MDFVADAAYCFCTVLNMDSAMRRGNSVFLFEIDSAKTQSIKLNSFLLLIEY